MKPGDPRASKLPDRTAGPGSASDAQATDSGGRAAERRQLEARCAALERENAELRAQLERLARSERDTRDAAFELPVAWANLDEAGTVLESNAALRTLLGVESELPEGLRLESLVALPQHAERLRDHLAAVFAAPGCRTCELWLRRPNGGITPVRVQSAAGRTSRRCRMALIEVDAARSSVVQTEMRQVPASRPPASLPSGPGAAADGAATGTTHPPRDRAGHGTVLVVEDESLVRKAVQHYLTAAGYHVLTAGDRAGALQYCEREDASIDLVLADLSLDDGSTGPEVAEQIRMRFPNVGVLYMTACPPELLARRGFDVPPRETLEKPFNKGALLDRVRKALASARARQAGA